MAGSDLNAGCFVFVAAILLLAAPAVATSDTTRNVRWIEVDPDENPKLAQIIEGQCLPTARHFVYPIPVSAQVLFVFWDGERPLCGDEESRSDARPDSVILLSRADLPDVIRKFRHVLKRIDFTEHVLPRESDPDPCCAGTQYGESYSGEVRAKTIFIRSAIDTFCWNKHLYMAPTVIVTKARDIYSGAGYQTVVELYRPDLTMPADLPSERATQGDKHCESSRSQ